MINEALPTWFLFFGLFVPRVTLFFAWIGHWNFYVPQPLSGIIWFFLPRVLILINIYHVMGLCGWFWLHFIFMIFAFGSVSVETSKKKSA